MEYSKLSDYDYHLPPELIAQEPLLQRDKSRMLVLNRSNKSMEHTTFNQLPAYLQTGDLLVLNNTRVIPARLIGKIPGRATDVELLLLHKLANGNWVA
ncbi:MAG: S-adenosylmethionine:tRNA ribosyltransferase-isomerase, partial [Clostridia bacterium]|nr:S-adenosylmethionine:tRNA ribosyltransferase-isomerase [Clostridia bacterium]